MKSNIGECKFIKIIKKIKLRTLIILIVLLVFNSYAWFIYSTKVSVGLTAHVSAWDIAIKAGEGTATDVQVDVERIYPGMDIFEKIIEVNNNGEVKARLSYEVSEFTILGEENKTSNEEPIITTDDLKNKLLNEYPFKVNVIISNEIIEAKSGHGTFKITVEWPFESGDDVADTQWGENAYEYFSVHPKESSLSIKLLLSIEQSNG